MIGVAGRDDLDPILDFIDFQGVGAFPHIVDETGDIWARYDVRNQPSFVFIDDDGTIVETTGSLDEESLNTRMRELVER